MQNKSFSLLLPCNRVHPWLEKCFISIRDNSPGCDFEILIVINNASYRDQEHIEHLAKEIIPSARILNFGKGSLADALNFGILNSTSNLIVRLDSDDELREGRIEEQIRVLNDNPNIAAVGTFSQVINDSGEYGRIVAFPTSSVVIKESLRYGNCLSHPTVAFNKHHVISVGMYSAEFPHAEDYGLWLKLVSSFEIVNLPIIGINYRKHSGQVSQSNLNAQILSTRLLAVNAIVKNLENLGCSMSRSQVDFLLSNFCKRGESRKLRIEKAKLELAQLRAFGQSAPISHNIRRIYTILLNNPYLFISWTIRKFTILVRGNHERQ
jgi:glycosyltransferase involved in cell wall biosynthesis